MDENGLEVLLEKSHNIKCPDMARPGLGKSKKHLAKDKGKRK